jgi:tetratricopeptide (TPR) repeat protein
MDEQRTKAYVNLIEQLLGCANGEELAVLQRHAELVDGGLLAVMAQTADFLEQQRNPDAALWLRQFAQQLAAELVAENRDTPSAESLMRESLAFLAEVLQLVANSQGDARQVYPFLTEHQQQLNDTLLQAMPIAASSLFNRDTNQLAFVAVLFAKFGNLIAQFPLGKRGLNLELAIIAYQLALQVYTRKAFPEQWAATQNNLAAATASAIRGDRADNLEQAIATYQLALQVRTREAFPEQWAATQNNLAAAYSERIRGDRADNLEQAIATYQLTLQVYTDEAFPKQWAATQYNLAAAYSERIRGDRANNLEQAIAAYQLALQVYTREAFPEDWVRTQNNLANAYSERIRGDRADNLEQAIAAYQLALQVYTREAFPRRLGKNPEQPGSSLPQPHSG